MSNSKKAKKSPAKAAKKSVKKTAAVRHDYEKRVLPVIAASFKKLTPAQRKERPRGFASGMYDTLAKRFNVSRNTADQYYWRAIWNHKKEIGLSAR